MPTQLEAALLDDTLHSLPGWEGSPSGITREIRLDPAQDEALREQVHRDAEAMGHHPTMEPIDGGTRYVLNTPDVGGVSELDVALASRISDLAHRLVDTEPGVEAVRVDAPEIEVGLVDADTGAPERRTSFGA